MFFCPGTFNVGELGGFSAKGTALVSSTRLVTFPFGFSGGRPQINANRFFRFLFRFFGSSGAECHIRIHCKKEMLPISNVLDLFPHSLQAWPCSLRCISSCFWSKITTCRLNPVLHEIPQRPCKTVSVRGDRDEGHTMRQALVNETHLSHQPWKSHAGREATETIWNQPTLGVDKPDILYYIYYIKLYRHISINLRYRYMYINLKFQIQTRNSSRCISKLAVIAGSPSLITFSDICFWTTVTSLIILILLSVVNSSNRLGSTCSRKTHGIQWFLGSFFPCW